MFWTSLTWGWNLLKIAKWMHLAPKYMKYERFNNTCQIVTVVYISTQFCIFRVDRRVQRILCIKPTVRYHKKNNCQISICSTTKITIILGSTFSFTLVSGSAQFSVICQLDGRIKERRNFENSIQLCIEEGGIQRY